MSAPDTRGGKTREARQSLSLHNQLIYQSRGRKMNKKIAFVLAAATLISYATAESKTTWDGTYATLKGRYLIYSGELGEQQQPTRSDRKMAFMVEGSLAKELFEAIGPALKDACGAMSGLRVRQKGHVNCTLDKDHPAAPYTCHFGLDLKSGKSIPGSIC